MRYIYSALLYLIAPFIPLYLNKRAKKNPDYGLHWNERYGFNLKNKVKKPIIWLHAVSVGETRAMAKLVEILSSQYPEYQILITQMTPTGRATAKSLYPNAQLHYVPYDLPHAVNKFYKTFKPKLGLIMETEIWPNLIYYAKKQHIPLFLINARLSDRSFKSYHKVKWMIEPVLNNLTGILCQDKNSANNFKQLGFSGQLEIIGNTKFDIIIDQKNFKLAKFLKSSSTKIVAFASTRDGEEKLILDSLPDNFDYVVLIIPRHPERIKEVEKLIQNKKLKYQKRSDNIPLRADTKIMLGDSMGEMFAYFAMSDLAVIGGSFVDLGGQNLIEPLYLHKPVIFGPSMYNFLQISQDALADKCAVQVKSPAECFKLIEQLFTNSNKYDDLAANCAKFISHYQGASQAVVNNINKYLMLH